MSQREKHVPDGQPPDGFISRWSRLKQAAASPPQPVAETSEEQLPVEAEQAPLTDADMPPLESLDETSDYSGFLSEQVSEVLRRQALRKLFHLDSFNVCDGLDDYADDFTSFAKLGDIITSDMRHQLAMAEERLKAALDSEQAAPATTAPEDQPATGEQTREATEQRVATDQDEVPGVCARVDSSPRADGTADFGKNGGTAS